MKDVQCYELFGGIALKNHAFLFLFILFSYRIEFMWRKHSVETRLKISYNIFECHIHNNKEVRMEVASSPPDHLPTLIIIIIIMVIFKFYFSGELIALT